MIPVIGQFRMVEGPLPVSGIRAPVPVFSRVIASPMALKPGTIIFSCRK